MWPGVLVSRLMTEAANKSGLANELKMSFHALLTQIVKLDTELLRLTVQ
jgi:hypothetical protein